MFLTPLDGRYLVTVQTARGATTSCAPTSTCSSRPPGATCKEYLERLEEREKAFTLSLDVTDLPYVLELKKDDPVWEELGKKCLCCGSCSMVCPTCACFNVMDETPEEGSLAAGALLGRVPVP